MLSMKIEQYENSRKKNKQGQHLNRRGCTIKNRHSSRPGRRNGQPVIVLEDGGALDLMSWVTLGYRVVKATAKERQGLSKIGLI